MPWFQIHQSFEDARVIEGYENTRNIPEYAHLRLICLDALEILKCFKTFTNSLNPESAMES